MRIRKVTNDDTTVTVEIREGDGEFSKLSTVSIDVSYGSMRITADIGNELDMRQVCLVQGGKVETQPYDRDKLNSIESEMENALRLFKEIAHGVRG